MKNNLYMNEKFKIVSLEGCPRDKAFLVNQKMLENMIKKLCGVPSELIDNKPQSGISVMIKNLRKEK